MFSYPEAAGLTSLKRLRTVRYAWILAALMMGGGLLLAAALMWVPWYQSVTGSGKVIIYQPMDRVQEVDAQISGRLATWYVREGDRVRRGQKLGLLQDIDSKFLDPEQVRRTEQMVRAYRQKQELIQARMLALDTQRKAIEDARSAALPAAAQRIEQNRQRLAQTRQSVVLSQQNLETDQLQMQRMQRLEQSGLRSRRDLELASQGLVRSLTELERTRLSLGVAQRDIEVSQLERDRLAFSLANDLAKVAESSVKARENLAEVEAEILKLQIDQSNLTERRAQQIVTAPRDGRVVRLLKVGEGKTVKAGDPLCTVMPATEDPAVELIITDFDAPLVHPGQRVRLIFDGFPAIPFTAFPWAAVGTFGGKITVVDAHDDGKGRYRVLIQPDGQGPAWPRAGEERAKYPLRPGTQVQAWIMMERPVPLYWEVWRRLNAFPPVPMEDSEKKEKDFLAKPVFKR